MIWQLHTRSDDWSSEGYEYFASEKALRERIDELRAVGYSSEQIDIDSAKTPATKAAMIRLLKVWASHADNG